MSSLPAVLGAGLFFFFSVPAFAQGGLEEKGEQIFNTKCISCHTVGGGKKVGPDLKGVTKARPKQWLISFISDPGKMFASKDPTAVKLLNEYKVKMPNLGLSADDVNAIIAFLESRQEALEHAPPAVPGGPSAEQPSAPSAPGDARAGAALFAGGIRFQRGGPPCVSCHNAAGVNVIGGGNLGPDLTTSYARYGGGMASVLTTIAFPTMRPLFAENPLTPREISDLTAYFRQTAAVQPRSGTPQYFTISAIAFVLIIIIGLLIWRNRLTGVRKALVERTEQERRGR